MALALGRQLANGLGDAETLVTRGYAAASTPPGPVQAGLLTRGLGVAQKLLTRGLGVSTTTRPTTIKTGLMAWLGTVEDVVDVVSTRIYPNHAARGASRPSIVVHVASDQAAADLDGNTRQRVARIILEVQSRKSVEVEQIARTLDAALQTHRGTLGGCDVRTILQETEPDDYQTPDNGTDRGIYTRLLDYRFDYRL